MTAVALLGHAVSNIGMTRLRATWAGRTALAIGAVGLAGYASSLSSAGRCERAVARRAAAAIGPGAVFALSGDSASGGYRKSAAFLRSAGLDAQDCHASGEAFDCFPWIGVADAQVPYPFLVDVRWGFVAAPLAGAGTRSRYVAVFGLVIHVADYGGWVT